MKRKIICVIAALSLLLIECGAGYPPKETSLSSADKKGEYIFVCPIMENEYWKACERGIRRADAELGTTTQMIGPETADNFAEEIIGYMEQAIEAHPAGIMLYSGIDALHPLINKAVAEGIPVLSVDSDAPETDRVAYLGTDIYQLGYKAGESMVELTGGNAKIGYICSSFSAQGEREMFSAFQNATYDYNMDIIARDEGHADPDYAEQVAEKMLTAHPEMTALFCTGGYNVTGAARVKERLGLDNLVLLGFEDVEENLAFVRKGVINTLIAQSPEQMGYRSVYLINSYIENGSLSSDTFYTETVKITQENVDTYANTDQAAEGAGNTVRVGYYSGDTNFQNGFSDKERKSGYAYEYYMAIAALTGWKYEYVYGTREESMNRLLSGEVDLVAGVYQTKDSSENFLLSKYDMGLEGDSRYFAVNSRREDLLTDLNNAMEDIQIYSPHFASELYHKYYISAAKEQILNDKERTWLTQKGKLRIGYVRSNLPLSDQDENGNPTGVISELLDALSNYLLLDLEPVCYDNVTLMEAGLSRGEIDAAFPIYSDVWLNENKGFSQTDSFINERVMLVYQGNYSDNFNALLNNVGLSHTGVGQRYYLEEYYPDASVTYYETREDVFEAIRKGEVECIIGCSSILQWFLSSHSQYQDMNIAYLPTSENFGMAVQQESSVLVGILNKAIRQMDEAKITNALILYSNVYTEPTFLDFLQRYVIAVIMILVLFFSALLLIFLAYRKKTIEFNREQAKTQAKLEEALLDAETANRSKTTFLSSMSHDIRTPMNAIVGMTTIAAKHLDDRDKVEDCLSKIALSSHHLLTLINDVLDISKIESGKLTLNPINFSLRDTIASLVNIIRPQIKSKNLQFDVHIHGIEHEIVYADEVRVNQIFINILTNAVKYTPDNGKIVMDLLQESLPDKESVRLTYTVSDTGIGMSEEFMANMYDTFTRAKDSRINKIQGTGLGLSIVKQMVDLMGGTIDCRSKEGEGTTFIITLEMPIGSSTSEKLTLPGVPVLIIDDDEIFLESAIETLRDMGALPEGANNGRKGIELLKARQQMENAFRIVIVDWKMPDMNGMEIIKTIEKEIEAKIPIILISAYDWSDIADDADFCAVNSFISKPLFPSYIYEKICAILDEPDERSVESTISNKKFSGMRFLIAEDNELNWEVLSELLHMYGISSDLAANGQICVDMISEAPEGKYDLILMDVQMPVMNGREATRAIRASEIPYVKNIPVIAMTADAFAEDIAACLEAGMDGHVSKPVDMDKLFQEITKVMK